MKKRIAIAIILILIFSNIITSEIYRRENSQYKDYINSQLNRSVYNTCDSMIEMNSILSKAINLGFISESELYSMKELYHFYLNNFSDYENLSKSLRNFNFNEVDSNHVFKSEYTEFYNRIDQLFDKRNYQISNNKYYFDDKQLSVFKKSYLYTSSVTDIIMKNLNYYNTFDIEVSDEPTDKGIIISFTKKFRREYLKPAAKNSTASGVKTTDNNTVTTIEVPGYEYPERPSFSEKDNGWYHILKEIYLLNLETKY